MDDAVGELQDPRAAGDRRGRPAACASASPQQHGVAIAHGDYRFGNCLTDVATGRIAAVLDWELCTLGDPLADVGYLGVYWADPGTPNGAANDPTGLEGFPTYGELLERYATRTGRDLSEIDYYVAFSSWRLAVICEGVYARYLHGAMGDQPIDEQVMNGFKVGTEALAESALDAMRRLHDGRRPTSRCSTVGSVGSFTAAGMTHPTYRRGTGPGVIVIHEIPGITPLVTRFANEVVDAGFTVIMPSLVGTPGKAP